MKRSNYAEEIAHGEIYTAYIGDAKKVRQAIDVPAKFIVPIRGESWKPYIPPNSRIVKLTDFEHHPELAPSKRLDSSYRRKLLDSHDYIVTYSLEMESDKCKESIKELALKSLSGLKVVIFGMVPKMAVCHRQMLAKLVAKAVIENSESRHRAKIKAYKGELMLL